MNTWQWVGLVLLAALFAVVTWPYRKVASLIRRLRKRFGVDHELVEKIRWAEGRGRE